MDLGLTLTMSWGRHWHMGSISDGVAQSAVAIGGRCLGNVSFSSLLQTTCGDMDTAQVASLRHWFEIALDTSVMLDSNDNIGGAMFVPVNSIDTLHSHQAEAAKQLDNLDEASLKWNNWIQMSSQIWR